MLGEGEGRWGGDKCALTSLLAGLFPNKLEP